jgi:CRISPR-associated protein Cmr6
MIPVSSNTREAIGKGAQHCDSRSLLASKFVFLRTKFNEARQIALDTFVDGGLDRLHGMRDEWKAAVKTGRNYDPAVEEAGYHLDDTLALSERVAEPAVDARFSERWLDFLKSNLNLTEADLLFAQLQSRLMMDMAGGVIENAGLCLDRWSGLPVISGSAVKGCAHLTAAAAVLAKASGITFDPAKPPGKQLGSRVGGAAFFSAWPVVRPGVPDQPKNLGNLELDILTSHHTKYYAEPPEPDLPHNNRKWLEWKREHDEWQREWGDAPDVESPNPVVFPAVAPGHVFVFAVKAADSQIGGHARRWLALGLELFGLGSKTAAGYGWFLPLGRRQAFESEVDERLADAQKRRETLLLREAERLAEIALEAERRKKEAEVEAQRILAENAKTQAEALARRTPDEWLKNFRAIKEDQKFAETAKRFPEMMEAERHGFAMALAEDTRKETRKRWRKNKPQLIQPWIEFAAKLSPPIVL